MTVPSIISGVLLDRAYHIRRFQSVSYIACIHMLRQGTLPWIAVSNGVEVRKPVSRVEGNMKHLTSCRGYLRSILCIICYGMCGIVQVIWSTQQAARFRRAVQYV